MAERELNVKLLPILVGLFAALSLLTGFRGWLAFFIGTFSLWLLAALWGSSPSPVAWATVGEAVPEELTLTCQPTHLHLYSGLHLTERICYRTKPKALTRMTRMEQISRIYSQKHS